MKIFFYIALLSCSNIFTLPEWQFTVEGEINGIADQVVELMPCEVQRQSECIHSLLNFDKLLLDIAVTCKELSDDKVEYIVEICEAGRKSTYQGEKLRATVTAHVGQDASVTFEPSPQDLITITFSSSSKI